MTTKNFKSTLLRLGPFVSFTRVLIGIYFHIITNNSLWNITRWRKITFGFNIGPWLSWLRLEISMNVLSVITFPNNHPPKKLSPSWKRISSPLPGKCRLNQLNILLNYQFKIPLGKEKYSMAQTSRPQNNRSTFFSEIHCENMSWQDGPVISYTDWP